MPMSSMPSTRGKYPGPIRAAVPSGYPAPSVTAAVPKTMNSTPAQKSFGWRIQCMRCSPRRRCFVDVTAACPATRGVG